MRIAHSLTPSGSENPYKGTIDKGRGVPYKDGLYGRRWQLAAFGYENGGEEMRKIEIDLAVHKAIEDGRQSFEESENAILRRLLKIDRGVASPRSSVGGGPPRGTRSSGAYSVSIEGQPVEGNTLRDLLQRVLLVLEKRRPGFLNLVASKDTRRGRKIVARSPEGVYPHAPHLRELASPLNDEWWFDSNVSREQVAGYMKKFAEWSGLPAIPVITKRTQKTTLTLEDLDL